MAQFYRIWYCCSTRIMYEVCVSLIHTRQRYVVTLFPSTEVTVVVHVIRTSRTTMSGNVVKNYILMSLYNIHYNEGLILPSFTCFFRFPPLIFTPSGRSFGVIWCNIRLFLGFQPFAAQFKKSRNRGINTRTKKMLTCHVIRLLLLVAVVRLLLIFNTWYLA